VLLAVGRRLVSKGVVGSEEGAKAAAAAAKLMLELH
jgi:hypothetical protein